MVMSPPLGGGLQFATVLPYTIEASRRSVKFTVQSTLSIMDLCIIDPLYSGQILTARVLAVCRNLPPYSGFWTKPLYNGFFGRSQVSTIERVDCIYIVQDR